MENITDNIVLKNTAKYKGAPDVDYTVPATLQQNMELLVETDRTVLLGQGELFETERQNSTTFRPTFKIDFLYSNNITGTTNYTFFKNSMFILNGVEAQAQKAAGVTETWYGTPQFTEFDLIRYDNFNPHLDFKPESASTYNWDYYITYPYSADTNYILKYYQNTNGNLLASFRVSEGIPATLTGATINGTKYLQFICPVKHGLSPGEFVKFPFSYNGNSYFEVASLGNFTVGSEEYIFNVTNPGYTGTTFVNGNTYIFKRVLSLTNTGDTTSRYYVRIHKVKLPTNELILEKAGFDLNPFQNFYKYEFSSQTPNDIARVSRLNNSQSYDVTNKVDLDINGLIDENQKPIDEIFLTFVNKGYAGWFYNQKVGLKRGWEFNLTSPKICPWWDFNEPLSDENSIVKSSYSKFDNTTQYDFYFNLTMKENQEIYGDWYEYNDYEQRGRVVSPYYHKMVYNLNNFITKTGNTNPQGYYYQVHHPMKIRAYSGYIEEGIPSSLLGIPPYAYFSKNLGLFRWREIYTYGYIDVDGDGVDYPFINLSHYPYTNVNFRLIPEGARLGLTLSTFIPRPLIDECE